MAHAAPTADDASRYQPREEVERWKEVDPLERYRRWLSARGLADDDLVERYEGEATQEMARIREGVIGSGPRPVEEMFEWVFADLPEHLRRQRDEAIGDG